MNRIKQLILTCAGIALFTPVVAVLSELLQSASELLISYITVLITKNQVRITEMTNAVGAEDDTSPRIGFEIEREEEYTEDEEFDD